MPEKISLVFSASPGSVLLQTIGGQQKKIRVWKIYTFFLNYAKIMCQKNGNEQVQCLYCCNIDQNDTNMQLVITYVVNDIIWSLIFTNYAV